MSSGRHCCVPGCKESGGMRRVLHSFPNPEKDGERFKTWLYAIGGDILGLENKSIFNYRRVCRSHFEDRYLCRNNKISNIAVPTLNMPGPLSLKRCTSDNRKPLQPILELPSTSSGICEDDDYAEDDSDTLVESNVCRVCLAMEVKMYDLKNIELREMFQNITGITVTQNNHSTLELLCWECAGRLKAAAAFRHKALLSDALLQRLASTGEQIRKNDITLIKKNKDYLKSAGTLNVVEVFHTVDIDPENDSITRLSENNDTEIVQNTVRKDSFELINETIIDEENDQTDVQDESMIEAPIENEMEYDQFDHILCPNTGKESSNAFIETNPLVSNYVTLGDGKINSADSSPLPGCSHAEPKYPIFGYLKEKTIDCEDKITKNVIITTNSISKIVSKDLKELISAKSKNINAKIGGVSKKTSNKKLVKKN